MKISPITRTTYKPVALIKPSKDNFKELKITNIHAFAFLSAGILSNTIERFVDGYVTDYFKLTFINFPVFNLADIFINIGVILLIFSLLFFDKRK